MTKRKLTAPAAAPKHIHVSTLCYPALDRALYAPPRLVPYIRLRGLWLSAAGFSPHDRLAVRVESGRIVLTRA
ncbi:type I toxin-antitoxin system SymE family toxin [Tahibacter soli]|uniref:Type I toxin-antitoxin system SymE family toxin n=1 Tax=Tahibacter soli TaxID=2983605 RepID=A0A9X3YJD3_9GAMM|nr:type I toxin-antitoxin system SymE family toxin [Tahibacter soli]MDC8011823.1 type I toxin-antitoxin system SymE family toxin [Tahibacter soli]